MRAFETDGLTAYRQLPLVVVLPETDRAGGRGARAYLPRAQHQGRAARRRHLAVGRRAAARRRRAAGHEPLQPHPRHRLSPTAASWRSRASPISASPTRSSRTGFYYAPDPSSQIACSIGGNVAENSGGVHCLKYGLTTNNVLGIEMVLIDGEVVRLGGKHLDSEGYDLLGVMTGSEGLLGVVTEVTVRILQKPETARALLIGFPDERAGRPVRRRDHRRRHHPGRHGDDGPAGDPRRRGFRPCRLSAGVEALLIVELDGPRRRGRPPDRPGRGDRREERLDHLPHLAVGAGAAGVLGRPQGGVPGGRPHLARLLLHGRHHPAQAAAAGAGRHARAVGAIRAGGRQRLPRRRRQSASADPLRRQQAGRTGQGRGISAPTSCGCASRSAAC